MERAIESLPVIGPRVVHPDLLRAVASFRESTGSFSSEKSSLRQIARLLLEIRHLGGDAVVDGGAPRAADGEAR